MRTSVTMASKRSRARISKASFPSAASVTVHPRYSVELRVAPVEKSLRIDCRPTEISQVLLNLLNNAVDAVQPLPEKWVELQVKNVGKDVEISVTDSGRGIPEKIRDKVGQLFFTTKVVGQGTGLG